LFASALVPAAGQRLEQGDLVGGHQRIGLGQGRIGSRQGALGVEHGQEAVGPGVEPQAGQTGGIGGLVPRLGQGCAAVQLVGVVGQGRLGLLQRQQNGLVEGRQGRVGAGVGGFDPGARGQDVRGSSS